MTETLLHSAFKSLRDPRVERGKQHNLLDIVILSILAVLSGAESYESIEDFGKENFAFFKQFLSLKNGSTSHDTIISCLSSIKSPKCFIAWAQG